MFEIFLFAMIAAFFCARLNNVLGRRTGNEKNSESMFGWGEQGKEEDNIVTLPKHRVKRMTSKQKAKDADSEASYNEVIKVISEYDSNFSLQNFLAGAKLAFGMILNAFTLNEKEKLKSLLDANLYPSFLKVIEEREQNGNKIEIRILGFDAIEMVNAYIDNKRAYIQVRFETQQKIIQESKIQGIEETTDQVIDQWTFARDLQSKNPNWQLVATKSEEL